MPFSKKNTLFCIIRKKARLNPQEPYQKYKKKKRRCFFVGKILFDSLNMWICMWFVDVFSWCSLSFFYTFFFHNPRVIIHHECVWAFRGSAGSAVPVVASVVDGAAGGEVPAHGVQGVVVFVVVSHSSHSNQPFFFGLFHGRTYKLSRRGRSGRCRR